MKKEKDWGNRRTAKHFPFLDHDQNKNVIVYGLMNYLQLQCHYKTSFFQMTQLLKGHMDIRSEVVETST